MFRRTTFDYQVDTEFAEPNPFPTSDNTVDTDNSAGLRSASWPAAAAAAAPRSELKCQCRWPHGFPGSRSCNLPVVRLLRHCRPTAKSRPEYHVTLFSATH